MSGMVVAALTAALAGCGGGGGGGAVSAPAPAPTLTPEQMDEQSVALRATPACAAGSPYQLYVRGGEFVDPAVLDKMECTFFRNYPKIVARLNPAVAPKTVRFTFRHTKDLIAGTVGDEVVYSTYYMQQNPKDIDVVTHEIVHVAQHAPDLPGWVIEGTADFLREQFGEYNADAGWSIVNHYEPSQKYTDGYGETASFFKWIDANYRPGMTSVVDKLQEAGMAGPYDPRIWVALTGHDLDTLWYLYSGKTVPEPPGAKCAPFAYPC